ncbi:hypothetical protein MTO96_015236 [Rhipicephalus appendiculatus]
MSRNSQRTNGVLLKNAREKRQKIRNKNYERAGRILTPVPRLEEVTSAYGQASRLCTRPAWELPPSSLSTSCHHHHHIKAGSRRLSLPSHPLHSSLASRGTRGAIAAAPVEPAEGPVPVCPRRKDGAVSDTHARHRCDSGQRIQVLRLSSQNWAVGTCYCRRRPLGSIPNRPPLAEGSTVCYMSGALDEYSRKRQYSTHLRPEMLAADLKLVEVVWHGLQRR